MKVIIKFSKNNNYFFEVNVIVRMVVFVNGKAENLLMIIALVNTINYIIDN